MSASHITSANDALDLICARYYGRQSGAVEQVLEANPDIAQVAHRLPAGMEITLPDIKSGIARKTVKLWD
ncbi:tail protein X [Aliiroseovarius lamellibrachiae]|uniref:tail protein X n=1 Tax=Aliiroseovarius lamellibrachiae TaxID=1924933 RepID=UPI001BE121AF|nr:tail protein X [Aliiroseovarius lamellibrachiae]MBT2130133.1 tail protein X [Aliiroseovarius lamellibrachiae]